MTKEELEAKDVFNWIANLKLKNDALEKENAELRAIAENQQSNNMSRYFENKKLKEGLTDFNKAKEEAKTIIQDLLSNSDEYARQRAMDFLKEVEKKWD